MKAFTDSRRLFWIGGLVLLFAGLWAAFIVLPTTSKLPDGPDIHVPKMENVLPPNAPKLGLETTKE